MDHATCRVRADKRGRTRNCSRHRENAESDNPTIPRTRRDCQQKWPGYQTVGMGLCRRHHGRYFRRSVSPLVCLVLLGQPPITRFVLPHGRMRSDPRLLETCVPGPIHPCHQLLWTPHKILWVLESETLTHRCIRGAPVTAICHPRRRL